MRISTRARYALKLMLDISKNAKDGAPIHLGEIASRNKLSRGYLEQLVISLKNSQLVRGVSGRKGGYWLARPPENISLLEIIQATIGPINLVECVQQPESCIRSEFCECRVLWQLLTHKITEVLAEYSLKDFSEKEGIQKMYEELVQYEGKTGCPEVTEASPKVL